MGTCAAAVFLQGQFFLVGSVAIVLPWLLSHISNWYRDSTTSELCFCFCLCLSFASDWVNWVLLTKSTPISAPWAPGSKPANLKWSAMVISFLHYVVGNGHWSRSKLNTLPFLALFLVGQNPEACYKRIRATCEWETLLWCEFCHVQQSKVQKLWKILQRKTRVAPGFCSHGRASAPLVALVWAT